MRFLSITTLLLGAAPIALSDSIGVKSSPFKLLLRTSPDTSSLNGTYLNICSDRTVDPYFSLCSTPGSAPVGSIFTYNSTNTTDPDGPGDGYLTYDLQESTGFPAQELIAALRYNDGSNVATVRLQPFNFVTGAFPLRYADSGPTRLFFGRWQTDDRVAPPVTSGDEFIALRFYLCRDGMDRYVLSWKMGQPGELQNPSCVFTQLVKEPVVQ